ncbi:MAG: endonuclease [Bacteroidota bacterium]
MKKNYLLLLLLTSFIGFAQIPAGYYNTATGTGYVLKTQLYNIIKGHTDRGYDGLYDTYQTSDKDNYYENDGTVLDMYSERPSSSDPYNYSLGSTQRCGSYSIEGDCYNREHIVPQSVFNEDFPMVSDAHHIPPTDGKVNGYRSNYPHGMVGTLDTPPATISNPTQNGSKLGNGLNSGYSTGYTGVVFEPIDEFKGDIARMYLYFATRYENVVAGYNYDMFNHTSNQVFTNTFKSILLAWHAQDGVSQREIDRNNAIYARQGNRNPYIDHPEWVDAVWTCPVDAIAPTAPTALIVTGTTSNSVSLSWTAATDNTGVAAYDVYVNGSFNATTGNTTYTVTGLATSTTYNFYVIAKDCQNNASLASNNVNGTTTAGGTGTATELFFSEYVEGSSNNKALEIINLTGASVDLSIYSIKRQTNGAGAWSTGLLLNSTLSNGSVYVIANTLTGSCASITPNLSSSAAEMQFNGNDPVGLFKNGVLIDIVGTFNGGASDFAINETLRRNSTVIAPNIVFNKSTEWTSFASDTCGGLGDATLDTDTFTENNFKIYPNPSQGKFNIDFEDYGSYSVEIFSTIGQKVFELKESNKQNIEVNHLQKGIYLVKITKDSKSIIKKIIIN